MVHGNATARRNRPQLKYLDAKIIKKNERVP
jgi:hypothetical protein